MRRSRWARGDAQGAIDDLRGDRRASGATLPSRTIGSGSCCARAGGPRRRCASSTTRREAATPTGRCCVRSARAARRRRPARSAACSKRWSRRIRRICNRPTRSADVHAAGSWRDAEALFRRVLAASPNAAATWNNLGSLYLASIAWRTPRRRSRAPSRSTRPRHRAQRARCRLAAQGQYGSGRAANGRRRWRCAPATPTRSPTWSAPARNSKKGPAEARPLKSVVLRVLRVLRGGDLRVGCQNSNRNPSWNTRGSSTAMTRPNRGRPPG